MYLYLCLANPVESEVNQKDLEYSLLSLSSVWTGRGWQTQIIFQLFHRCWLQRYYYFIIICSKTYEWAVHDSSFLTEPTSPLHSSAFQTINAKVNRNSTISQWAFTLPDSHPCKRIVAFGAFINTENIKKLLK